MGDKDKKDRGDASSTDEDEGILEEQISFPSTELSAKQPEEETEEEEEEDVKEEPEEEEEEDDEEEEAGEKEDEEEGEAGGDEDEEEEEEEEEEESVVLALAVNENEEDDPLPGWTTSGQMIFQCTEPGGRHSPIVGVACPMTYEGDPGDPQVGSYKLKLPFFRAGVRLKQYML